MYQHLELNWQLITRMLLKPKVTDRNRHFQSLAACAKVIKGPAHFHHPYHHHHQHHQQHQQSQKKHHEMQIDKISIEPKMSQHPNIKVSTDT